MRCPTDRQGGASAAIRSLCRPTSGRLHTAWRMPSCYPSIAVAPHPSPGSCLRACSPCPRRSPLLQHVLNPQMQRRSRASVSPKERGHCLADRPAQPPHRPLRRRPISLRSRASPWTGRERCWARRRPAARPRTRVGRSAPACPHVHIGDAGATCRRWRFASSKNRASPPLRGILSTTAHSIPNLFRPIPSTS